jgi:hypothetical protein
VGLHVCSLGDEVGLILTEAEPDDGVDDPGSGVRISSIEEKC